MNKLKKYNSVTIIGMGISGIGLAKLAKSIGMKVFVSELKNDISSGQRDQLKKLGVTYELGGHTKKVLECDAILLSSGVSPVVRGKESLTEGELLLTF